MHETRTPDREIEQGSAKRSAASAHRAPGSIVGPLALLLVGIAVALVAQFPLDAFGDSSDLGHWTQHALLFWSGIAVGLGVYGLYRRAQERM